MTDQQTPDNRPTIRLQELIDTSPDVILVVDSDGRIAFTNGRIEGMLGYDPEAIIGDPVERLIADELVEEHISHRDRYFQNPTIRQMGAGIDLEAVCADGTRLPVDISLSPIGEDQAVAVVRDVTDRHRLQQSYRTILEAVPDPVIVADAASGEIIETNENVTDLFGCAPEDLIGKRQTSLHPSDEADRYRQLFENHVAEGEAIFTELEDGTPICIERVDGEHVPVEINAKVFDADGQTHIVGVFRDISERQRRLDQLHRQKARIEALHRAAAEISACDDPVEVSTRLIDTAESILSFDLAIVDLVEGERLVPIAVSSGLTDQQYFDTVSVDASDNIGARVYRSGQPHLIEDFHAHDTVPADADFRSGITVPIGTHGVFQAVSREPGTFDEEDLEVVELLVAHAESALTSLERTTELERHNARLEQFAKMLSHDIPNHLMVATGRVDLARETGDHEHLEPVLDAHDRIETLVRDMRDLIMTGQPVETLEPVSMRTLATACWSSCCQPADPQTLDIVDDITIAADESRLKQLVENLFWNACDHGGEGVTVRIGEMDDGIYIEDDGPGIPDQVREEIFEAGYSTRDGSIGFGLAIVREVAEAHGWEVIATEGREGGARFELHGVEIVDRE